MKFKHGDQVRFLNETGGGTVSRLDDRGLVYVLTEDGFEIPVMEKELVLSRGFAYASRSEEPEQQEEEKKKEAPIKPNKEKQPGAPVIPESIPANQEVNIMLGFIPEHKGPVFSSDIACYLINDSPLLAYFMAGKKEGGSLRYLTSGFVEADTKAMIGTFDQTTMSKISDIHIQIMLISKGKYNQRAPVDQMVNMNLVNFSKESYFRENDYFEEKAVLFNLMGKTKSPEEKISIPAEIFETKIKADISPEKPVKKELPQDTLEVDLHMDEMNGQNSSLAPGAILALQMSRFHSAMEEVISKNIRRLVIIHGLGQGTLKMQIRKELQEKYPGCIYQDASFKEYGFGATMVHLTFNKKQ